MIFKGQIEFQGDYQSFVAAEENFVYLSLDGEENEVAIEEEYESDVKTTISTVKKEKNEPQETKELISQERLKISLIWKYFKAGGSSISILLIMFLFVIAQLAVSIFDYWLSYW